MSYLLTQMLLCLLIAGLIGGIIGWFLRGGCEGKLKECEERWRANNINSSSNSTNLNKVESDLKDRTNKEYEKSKMESLSAVSSDIEKDTLIKDIQDGIKIDDNQTILDNPLESEKKFIVDRRNCYPLHSIEGITENHIKKLNKLGIENSCDLIERFYENDKSVSSAAKAMRIKSDIIKSWTSMADLLRVPGIGGVQAKLLHSVNIKSVKELSEINIKSLQKSINDFNKNVHVLGDLPSEKSLSSWIKLSKNL